jgi:hypothetical protein
MLEHSCLHVDAWTLTEMGDLVQAWIRRIRDAGSKPVGFVRFHGQAPPSWFSWLRGARLDVYETDDASYLMSLVRSWGMARTWEVYDAEERHVGAVYHSSLVDSNGERRGYLVREDHQRGRIVDPAHQVLARFRKETGSDLEVIFTRQASANPFLRMLVLGSILTLDPAPKIVG